MDPLVTCLISAYNARDTITDCVRSLTSQDYENLEILIVDDGSTDGTAVALAELQDPRIRIVTQENHGLYYSLAKGANLATGKYIARLDADDQACPGRIRAQVDFLEAHADIALVGGAEVRVDAIRGEEYLRIYPGDDASIRTMSAKCIPYAHSAWMYRKSLVESGLNYDPNYDFMGDFEYFIRIAQKHRIANLPTPAVKRFVSSTSFFQSRFNRHRQNVRLSRLCIHAVRRFRLPSRFYLYPLARLIYPYVPDGLKRRIRRRQGLEELHV